MKRIKKYQKAAAVLVLALSAGLIWFNFDRWFVHPVFSGKQKTGHLIVISVDALNSRDFEQISALPNFRKLLSRGAYAREVEGVYPSLTYPAHTTIITGVYPDKHGIVNNEVFQAGAGEMDWFWFDKYIKVPTLYDIAPGRSQAQVRDNVKGGPKGPGAPG